MRIALITERFDPNGGGAERSCLEMAQEFAARGHEITVLAGAGPRDFKLDGITLRLWGRRLRHAWQLLAFARWAETALQNSRFDASLSVTTAVPAVLLQPRSGTHRESLRRSAAASSSPLARALRPALQRLAPKKLAALWLEGRTLRHPRVSRFVAISRYVQTQLTDGYRIDPARIVLVPNAARLPQDARDPQQRQRWRTALRDGLGIRPDQAVFLFAALNPRLKGLKELLRAFRLLPQPPLDPILLLAGNTDWAHDRAIIRLGLRPRVRFLGPTRNMPAAYAAADVTVLPTQFDPASKVVIESLMMGVPAITTRYNGAADLLLAPDGRPRGRILADPADAPALAQAMRQLADPAARDECRAAMAGLEDELSMSRHADRLLAVLQDAALAAAHLPT